MSTIFNRDNNTVTIPENEYQKLLQYKKICQEFRELLGGDSE